MAICDVDWKYALGAATTFPNEKKWWDWREMFDEMDNDSDAVVIATADHSHAIIATHAMTMA